MSISVEQCIIIKFLTAEGVQPLEIFQRLKKQFEEVCLSRTQCSNGVKPSKREEREWRTCRLIVNSEHQSPHPYFWDLKGVIHLDFLQECRTINAEYYSNILLGEVKDKIQSKRETGGFPSFKTMRGLHCQKNHGNIRKLK